MEPAEEQGIILRCREHGDNLLALVFLSSDGGLRYPLLRQSKTKSRPDIFDTARIKLTPARQGNLFFASGYTVLRRRTGLAKSFSRLTLASRFADIVRCNVQHLPDHDIIFGLSAKLFDSLESEPAPEAAYLKTLYLFARTEGFPIREDWTARLDPSSRTELQEILRAPLSSQVRNDAVFKKLTASLEEWLVAEAHFVISQ